MEKLPVLILAFNRADHVEKAMAPIREYKPSRIYLECDGARGYKQGEVDAVALTRKTMTDLIDWPCEVHTLFRKENMGCAKAVYGAISWFFEHEEYGCIIEDDIVVSQDFFRFCEDMLVRYKNEEKVMQISARNHEPHPDEFNSYRFCVDIHCWGWASWRRAWQKMDMSMSRFPDVSMFSLVKTYGLFHGLMTYRYWDNIYDNLETSTSWATRWFYSIYVNKGLVVVPGNNLATNIGFDGGAHYDKNSVDPYSHLKAGNMNWPLDYNDRLEVDRVAIRRANRDFFRIRMLGLKKKLKLA